VYQETPTPASAARLTLRLVSLAVLLAAIIVTAIRYELVRRALMAPPAMKAAGTRAPE
jgi:hypothetical protein